jgi:hypothetical protein
VCADNMREHCVKVVDGYLPEAPRRPTWLEYVVCTRVCMIQLGVFMLAVGTLRLEYRVVREGVKHIKEYGAPQ